MKKIEDIKNNIPIKAVGLAMSATMIGTTIPFALEIVKYLIDEKKSKEIM